MRLILLLLSFAFSDPPNTLYEFRIQGRTQGTTYHITYFAEHESVKKFEFDSLFAKIDTSVSLYNPHSLINAFNHGSEIRMDDHFERILKASCETWKKSGGLFDITVEPLLKAWGFGPDAFNHEPDSSLLAGILPCVGSEYLHVKGHQLTKEKDCVQIDMNGIAQGYTVDRAALLLEQNHVINYVVEVGGELRVRGHKPDGKSFSIGIESPNDDPFNDQLESRIRLDKGAVTTSGSYRQYREYNGKRYAHLINPHTGFPVENDLISVTVYAPDAMTADAYDNVLMLLGMQKALAFVEKHKSLAAYCIYKDKAGQVRDTASSRFYPLLNP